MAFTKDDHHRGKRTSVGFDHEAQWKAMKYMESRKEHYQRNRPSYDYVAKDVSDYLTEELKRTVVISMYRAQKMVKAVYGTAWTPMPGTSSRGGSRPARSATDPRRLRYVLGRLARLEKFVEQLCAELGMDVPPPYTDPRAPDGKFLGGLPIPPVEGTQPPT